MRFVFLAVLAFAPNLAGAQCPPSCVGGGGPGETDCFLAYAGVPGKTITCVDGDAGCDVDGRIDGTCTFALAACTNESVGACTATPLDAPPAGVAKGTGAEAFLAALGQLATTSAACTESGLVKLTVAPSSTKLKPAKLTLRLTAVAGGKKDKDTLKLVCNPARPSLATDVQPLFTAMCSYAGCHSGALPQSSLSLEEGRSAAALAEKALGSPKVARVRPGSLKKSYLAWGVLGINGAKQMPSGCPDVVAPVERCLAQAEAYTILAWIQAGALP